MPRQSIFAIVAVVLLIGVAGAALGQSDRQAAEPQSVTNESLTVNYSAPTAVDNGEPRYGWNDSVTVYNASGNQLQDGTDYEWNSSTGEVTWFNTSATTDGETASISYTYEQRDATTAGLASLFGGGYYVLGLLVLVIGIGLVRELTGGAR